MCSTDPLLLLDPLLRHLQNFEHDPELQNPNSWLKDKKLIIYLNLTQQYLFGLQEQQKSADIISLQKSGNLYFLPL
jgi:hypothetical protein